MINNYHYTMILMLYHCGIQKQLHIVYLIQEWIQNLHFEFNLESKYAPVVNVQVVILRVDVNANHQSVHMNKRYAELTWFMGVLNAHRLLFSLLLLNYKKKKKNQNSTTRKLSKKIWIRLNGMCKNVFIFKWKNSSTHKKIIANF